MKQRPSQSFAFPRQDYFRQAPMSFVATASCNRLISCLPTTGFVLFSIHPAGQACDIINL